MPRDWNLHPVWNKGIKLSKKHCLNLSKSHLGKMTGKQHPQWNGGKSKTVQGYLVTLRPQKDHKKYGRYIYEHRRIMEEILGRRLNRNEVVHHKNHIKTDNRPFNLEIMSNSEHTKKHHKKFGVINCICLNCSKKFKRPERIIRFFGKTRTFCSRKCCGLWQFGKSKKIYH